MWTSLLAERPLLLSLMLGIFAAGSLYGWLQTGKKPALLVAGVAIALIPVAWVVASRWVTDREQIELLLHEVAAAINENDHQRALAVIGDERLRRRAETELQRYEFREASIQRIRRIEVLEGTFPLEADVELTVKVIVSSPRMQLHEITVPRRLVLRLEKRPGGQGGGRWVVMDYQHGPVTGGTDLYSTITSP